MASNKLLDRSGGRISIDPYQINFGMVNQASDNTMLVRATLTFQTLYILYDFRQIIMQLMPTPV
jgi:hypothetical protein